MNSSPFFTIVNGLIFLGILGLAVQAFIGFSFFVSKPNVGPKWARFKNWKKMPSRF
jgi:hypothetical protein